MNYIHIGCNFHYIDIDASSGIAYGEELCASLALSLLDSINIFKGYLFYLMKLSLICYIFYVGLVSFDCQTNLKQCEYATSNKPIGYYEITPERTGNILPYYSTITATNDKCNDDCRISDHCLATSYDSDIRNCSFYNRTDFRFVTGNLRFSVWNFCNMTEGKNLNDGRCQGRWVIYHHEYNSVKSYEILGATSATINECEIYCENNSLCGSLNYQDNACIFVPKWPYEKFNSTFNENFNMANWTCVDNFVENLIIPKKQFKPIDEKCTGYWEIVSRNDSSNGQDINGLFFQTQAFKNCLEECDQYAKCRVALFNVTYSICVLPDISQARNGLPSSDTRFIKFEWKCDRNDSYHPQMNEDEKRYSSLGMKCRRIISNKDLYIGKDDCGKFPSESQFVKCTKLVYDSALDGPNVKDSCQVNQSYWSFLQSTVSLNLTGSKQMNITKIYTGLAIYWLAYMENNNLREVDYVKCRSFNASRPKLKLRDSDIKTKKQWQGLQPRGKINVTNRILSKIDVSASQSPYHSCRTLKACMDMLRALQVACFDGCGVTKHFSDIAFNFMVSDNGDIYEGRGWNYQCAAVREHNPDTLCIAYLGWFRDKLPNERVVNGMKMFIEYAVEKGYVDKNYKLFIQQDLGTSEVHRNLVIVIRNWYHYRGFIPKDCINFNVVNICLNIFPIIFVCLSLRLFYTWLHFAKMCHNCKFLHSKKISFTKISSEISSDTLIDSESDTGNKYCIIYDRYPWLTNNSQSNLITIIKTWFLGKFLNIQDFQHISSLDNYLAAFYSLTESPHVYKGQFLESQRLSDMNIVILCVHDERSYRHFRKLTIMGHCICSYFKVDQIDLLVLTNVMREMHTDNVCNTRKIN